MQTDNTEVQSDNTEVQSDGNAVQSVQTGEQGDRAAQTADNDIMQTEQESMVVAKDEVPLESLKPEVAQSLKRMSEATGRKVHAYTKPAGEAVVENGYFKDGEIWINTEGRLPHVQVFSHELTHSIETSRYYADIREIAFRELGKKLDLDSYRKGTKELYESNGQRVTKEDIDREIVAEYVADYLLADEQSILNLTRENRGIAKKVLNWIDGMLARFGNRKAQERLFLQNARSIYARALNETRGQNTETDTVQEQTEGQTEAQAEGQFDWEQVQPTDMESYRDWIEGQYRAGVMDEEEYQGFLDYFREQEEEGNLKKRYSYAGQRARNADLQSLDTARKMEEQEVSAETIRQQTGWFRGDDGKWRLDTGTSTRTQGAGIENKKTPSGMDGENTMISEGDEGQFSISRITGEEKDYGEGVILDTNIFDGVKPRDRGRVLGDYVYKNLAGAELTVYDEKGEQESVYLARENDRIRKDGEKNSHKVLDKLAGYRGNDVRAKSIVHISELLETSKYDSEVDNHNHQWMDENGWEFRKAYVQTMDGDIYEATLNIAVGRDRKTLYEVNRIHKVDKTKIPARIPSTDISRHSRYQESGMGRSQSGTNESVSRGKENVNGQFSLSPVGKVAEQAQEQQEKTVRERMKRKGREYLAGVERKMVNSIAKQLNVPYYAKREKLMPIMQKLSDTYDVINKMTALKPKDGSTYVSDAQKLRVIVDSGLSEKDMVKLVQSTSIGNTMKTRLPILVDNGVSITKQLQFWEKIFDFDADGSGKLNQREVRACLDSFPGGNNNPLEALMGITSSSGPAWTTAEKAAMWQSYNKQFSARKNPYDRKVGEKVKADINAEGEKDKEPEKKQTDQASTGLTTGNAEVDRILGLR